MKNLDASELSRRRLVPAKKSRKPKSETVPGAIECTDAAGNDAGAKPSEAVATESKED